MASTAACVAVGSELLAGDRLDSNSLTITTTLARCGVRVVEKRVVGDSVELVADTVRELLERVELVVVTGGLGPTADDITREAVALALGRELVHSSEVEEWIRRRYGDYGRDMPDLSLRMADVVDGARPLSNTRGSAPGMLITVGERLLAVFPGVPWEMEEMLERDLVPQLELRHPGVRVETRTLLLGGVFESDIEDRIRPLYDRYGNRRITILAKCGVVRLILSAEGDEAAVVASLDDMEGVARELLTDDVAGVDVDGLEAVVLDQLRRHHSTLATAESCTGGLLGARMTEVAGASDVYLGGIVSYSNEVKQRQLGVPEELLVRHGAVSEPVARAMADGVRQRFGSDWGIGITGIAGPGGGTEDKPVGLVHWAVASPKSVGAGHRVFPGGRAVVRTWSVHSALDMLRRMAVEGLGR
jgi:nicotinamide-nucleotide amidase